MLQVKELIKIVLVARSSNQTLQFAQLDKQMQVLAKSWHRTLGPALCSEKHSLQDCS